jgi:G:T-mismatch repair DNA endonuclease (very short patch repair protein)
MNTERDAKVKSTLELKGVKVLVIWECSIKRAIKENTLKKHFTNQLCSVIKEMCCSYYEI